MVSLVSATMGGNMGCWGGSHGEVMDWWWRGSRKQIKGPGKWGCLGQVTGRVPAGLTGGTGRDPESSGVAVMVGAQRGAGQNTRALSYLVTPSFQTRLFFTTASEFTKNTESLLSLLKF